MRSFLFIVSLVLIGCESKEQPQPMTTEQAEKLGEETYKAYQNGVARAMGYESIEQMNADIEKHDRQVDEIMGRNKQK